MFSYRYDGKAGRVFHLDEAEDLVVVRTQKGAPLESALESPDSQEIMKRMSRAVDFPEADVTVLRCQDSIGKLRSLRDRARAAFSQEKSVRFAGKVLKDRGNNNPVVYTENLVARFDENLNEEEVSAIIEEYGLKVKEKLDYVPNGYFLVAPEGTGTAIFNLANQMLEHPEVASCHPELIRKAARRATIAPEQWHLQKTTINGKVIDQHVNVKPAWQVSEGENIVIAVIDDGVDMNHEEFSSAGKIVAPRDVTRQTNDPSPEPGNNHGTACAGVACADGKFGAAGVAPKAKLMPIRLMSNLGSKAEADAFIWAADNGADVISCSWGPIDGAWYDQNDPQHQHYEPLPSRTKWAIDYAINKGRNGKGCVITWAAGNGNESVENDGYAGYDKVIAVAACNDRGKRSVYSDYGDSVWCAFPSNDFGFAPYNHPDPETEGIWTTDREGAVGYSHNDYASDFGGTSSACPGIAGIAALVLSADPSLAWDQVKGIIREAAVPIDTASGSYDAQGHSPYYGYGRPDAEKAVALVSGVTGPEQLKLKAETSGNLAKSKDNKVYEVFLSGRTKIDLEGVAGLDVDLYVKRGVPPTVRDFDYRSWTPGGKENLTVDPATPGKYFIMVNSYSGSGDYSLNLESA